MSAPDPALVEPVFTEPWHAQVFALTVHLNETGRLDWPSWAAAFGKTLECHGLSRALDGGDDYFTAWLETLETLMIATGVAGPQDLARFKSAWEEAYLSTPHGAPVSLPD